MSSFPQSSDPRLTAADCDPLPAPLIEAQLDELLDPVLSPRRTATRIAAAAARLPRERQEFMLHWTAIVARTNPELAYQFAQAAPRALSQLEPEAAEAWVIRAMDVYDSEGLHRGTGVLRNAGRFARFAGDSNAAIAFDDVANVFRLYACGLTGRRMELDTALRPYTDSTTIFMPPRIGLHPGGHDNFLLYKIILTLLWAQNRYGTFDADLAAACEQYDDPGRALDLLDYFEAVRLEARIAEVLPGLARDMERLRDHALPQSIRAVLQRRTATIHDSLSLLAHRYRDFTPPTRRWGTVLRPDDVAAARRARLAREKSALQSALGDMLDNVSSEAGPTAAQAGAPPKPPRFSITVDPDAADPGRRYEIRLGEHAFAPSQHLARLLDSILQDLGRIPGEYLQPPERIGEDGPSRAVESDALLQHDMHPRQKTHFYDEWDHHRQHYRKRWCTVREHDLPAGDDGYVESTLRKYAPQIARLKRTFELLRGEDRLLRRQPHGDDIDIDAVIRAYGDMESGMELGERLLVKRQKSERNLAVMLMVDMSGSTKGWINEAEREALVMLCEALEVLGDRYAIYGFSGMTRKRCEIFRVKRFDEPYDAAVKSRIAAIAPHDYTRMGAAIRHLCGLLRAADARVRLLITLSDGRPDDYSDGYRGDYGVEDTRQALIEAHRSGVKPFCITIDREARDYLPRMYGAANWTLVQEVSRLPLKVADIYRRIAT